MSRAGEILGADAVFGLESAVKIGVIPEAAVLVDVGGRQAVRKHLFCNDKPLLNDIAVDAGAHKAVELMGQVIFVDKEARGQHVEGKLLVIVVVDIVEHVRHDRPGLIRQLVVLGGIGRLPVQLHQKLDEAADGSKVRAVIGAVGLGHKALHQVCHMLARRGRQTQQIGVAGHGGIEAVRQRGVGRAELLQKAFVHPQHDTLVGMLFQRDAGLVQLQRADEQDIPRQKMVVPALDGIIDVPV